MIQAGEQAPDFSGVNEYGETVRLSDYRGQKLVLYFYPKDSTPGCTSEACSLRDNFTALRKAGYQVLGVSADSVKSHARFKEKNNLPFTLVSDEDRSIVQKYGVWGEKKLAGRTYMGINRTTFLIDGNGIVQRVIGPKEIKVKNHSEQILHEPS